MIILKTNPELKATFEKLIQTMKEPVEWNGQFVVIGDYLILHGRVRSLFFNFETRQLITNLIDIPVQEEEIHGVENHIKVQNVLNMVLYAFGKWGLIRGIKVDQDYAALNLLFLDVLRELSVEPGYSSENFRFYRNGIRLSYEDVVQYAIDAEEEKPVEHTGDSEDSAGLWHNLVWKTDRAVFVKTETTFEDRQKNRLGNNFYMVGFQCPKCKGHLHMTVFPEGNEFRIETSEGAVLLARAYTCSRCNCFYTPRPGLLLSERDVFGMEFLKDRRAYEDYLELLGAKGDRVSNHNFNKFERDSNQHRQQEQEKPLEELCGHMEDLSDDALQEMEDKIEEGFYPAKSVQRFENFLRRETGRRNAAALKAAEGKNQQKQAAAPGSGKTAAGTYGRDLGQQGKAGARPEADRPSGAGKEPGAGRQVTSKAGALAGVSVKEGAEADRRQEAVSAAKREAAKKRFQARCELLDRLSPSQTAELKREIRTERSLSDAEKEPFLQVIEKKEAQRKREQIRKLADSCEGQNYARIQRVIQEIEKADLPEAEKQPVLEPLYAKRKEQGEAEVKALILNMPKRMDMNQYRTFMERLQKYPEVDLTPYDEVLKEKQKQAQNQEISNMIRRIGPKNRQGMADLVEKLKKQGFDEEILAPYLEKLEDKIRAFDEEAIAELCGNPMQMTAEDILEAYQKIEAGVFLPELKTNALKMLKKRLEKIKTDECELLVNKLKDNLKGRIKENDRYHYYPARKVMKKEAKPEEMQVIQYALDTYGTQRGMFEYPILVIDTSRDGSGKEGMILTPEHLFYRTFLNAFAVHVNDIRRIHTQTGLLNAGVSMELLDGAKVKLPYAVEKRELTAWGTCLGEFIRYLQEKPDSRKVTYLAKESHETICCFRCGYSYKEGNVCPKCGYKMNR